MIERSGLKVQRVAADASPEGTAIRDRASSQLDQPRTPRAPHGRLRGGTYIGPVGRRFSPLTAREREGVDNFLTEARPWALRQAKRTYRHLPEPLQQQAIEDAMVVLRAGAAHSDRRSLYGELSEALDEALRRVHVGWCLSQAPSLYQRRDDTRPDRGVPTPPGEPITKFIEDGLGGLERAVLQLEIGAGRDSSVVRAALKLGPRQYARHRENGLAKLRGAITGQLAGRVCDQHRDTVTLAATGDRSALDDLSTGSGRCRSCAREAGLMRRVLHERLAMAPWPLAIKPAGVVAAKLSGLGAILSGGKTAGSGSVVTAGAGASGASPVLATIVAASVMATVGIATTGIGDVDGDRRDREARAAAAAGTQTASAPAAATAAAGGPHVSKTSSQSTSGRRTRARRKSSGGSRAVTGSVPAAHAALAGSSSARPAASRPVTLSKPNLDGVTNRVKQTVRKVTRTLPSRIEVPGTGAGIDAPDVSAAVGDAVDAADDLAAQTP